MGKTASRVAKIVTLTCRIDDNLRNVRSVEVEIDCSRGSEKN
jgi:hypothetical protein